MTSRSGVAGSPADSSGRLWEGRREAGEVPGRPIGDVLAQLVAEFPEVSASKIRYLETQGLVHPQRGRNGRRLFSDDDVTRLRWVLRQQRDRFLPLRVIRERLATADPADGRDQPTPRPSRTALPKVDPGVSLTREELLRTSRLDADVLGELESFGMVTATSAGGARRYDHTALMMARLAARFSELGMAPRHLRMFKVAADREAGFLAQLIAPLGEKEAADDRLAELVELGAEVRAVLLRSNLDDGG